MEILFSLKPKIETKSVIFPIPRPSKRHCKNDVIPCRAGKLDAQNGRSPYEVLSLDSENVGMDEIRRAYRSLALRYHPDVCHPSRREESTQAFIELRKAYETLSDRLLRREYDCGLRSGDLREQSRSRFPKDVWENQLYELKRRSNVRVRRNRNGCTYDDKLY